MAFSDYGIGLSETAINAALATQEKVRGTKAQFTRQGDTTRWFRPESRVLKGKRTVYRAFVQPFTGTRRATWSGGDSTEWPVAMKLGHMELSYDWDDLRWFRATVKWSKAQEMKHENAELAVYALVDELYSQAVTDIAGQMNAAIFQNYNASIGLVAGIYNVDGTTFTGGSGHAEAYIHFNGPISNIQKGDVLDFYDSASAFGGSDTQNQRVVVKGVIKTPDGPPSAGDRVADIGPGFFAEPCAVDGSTSTGTGYTYIWTDAMSANDGAHASTPAAGDFIARSGEFHISTLAGGKNFHGLPDWFDSEIDCLKDKDGTALDREAVDYTWMNPAVYTPSSASAGSEVEFSLDTHIGEMEDTLPYALKVGRAGRRSLGEGLPGGPENGIELSEHLVAICEPKMVRFIAQSEPRGSDRFVHTGSLNEAAAKALKRVGVGGWEGYVYHSPTLGEIVFQSDTNCTPYHMYFLEQDSFFWLEPPGGQKVRWNDHNGSRVWPIPGDTLKTPTTWRQAAPFALIGLMCDQPQANCMLQHITTG